MKFTVNFNLKKGYLDKQGKAQIYLIIRFGQSRPTKIFTGETCDPDNWIAQDKRGRVIQRVAKKEPYAHLINDMLETYEQAVQALFREARKEGITITSDYIKSELKNSLSKVEEEPEQEVEEVKPEEDPNSSEFFFKKYDEWIEKTSRKKSIKNENITKGTISHYRHVKNLLNEFSQSYNYEITYSAMDDSFYTDFQEYVMDILEKAPNTFGKYIKNIKTFLNWSDIENYPVNRRFRHFKAISEFKGDEVVALNSEEMLKIYNIDFSDPKVTGQVKEISMEDNDSDLDWLQLEKKIKTIETMRDEFYFMCSTGMHVSDMWSFKEENINSDVGVIVIKRGKNKRRCRIPFFDDYLFKAVEMTDKYKGHGKCVFPRNTHMNRYLKFIQRIAGIDKKLTAKVGRKTFGSIMYYERNVPISHIMETYGHAEESTTRRYLGVDDSKIIEEYRDKAVFMKAN